MARSVQEKRTPTQIKAAAKKRLERLQGSQARYLAAEKKGRDPFIARKYGGGFSTSKASRDRQSLALQGSLGFSQIRGLKVPSSAVPVKSERSSKMGNGRLTLPLVRTVRRGKR